MSPIQRDMTTLARFLPKKNVNEEKYKPSLPSAIRKTYELKETFEWLGHHCRTAWAPFGWGSKN